MADVETKLKTVLTSGSVTPSYLLKKPETVSFPCVVYQLISTNPFDASLSTKAGVYEYRYQFSTVGSDYGTVKALATKLRSALDHNTTDFDLSYFGAEYQSYDENGLYQIIQDFFIIY